MGDLRALICHSAFAKLFSHLLFHLVFLRSLKTMESCLQCADEETELPRGLQKAPSLVKGERRVEPTTDTKPHSPTLMRLPGLGQVRRVREDILGEGGFEWFWKKKRSRCGMGRGKVRCKIRGGQGLQVPSAYQ